VTRCTGRRGGGRREALRRRGDGDGRRLTGSEAAPAEEGGHGGRRWSRRSLWLGERAGRSICGSNGTNGKPRRPEVELAKNGDGGGDLSRPGLLRCRGGGPREAGEDEGLPVLLGYRSGRTKGSTRARGGVAHRGRGGKGEGGVRLSAQERRKEKGWSPVAWHRVEEENVGGGGLAAGKAHGRRRRWPVAICRVK
jgi:hypothetical protein